MREQVCAFFYMHNFNIDPAELSLRDRLVTAISYLWFPKETATFEGFDARMRALTGDAGFAEFLRKVATLLTDETSDLTVMQKQGGINARCKSG